MNFPATLFAYIARQFLLWFGAVFLLFLMLIYIGDFIELSRRAANHPEATTEVLLKMAALKLPFTAQEVMPFAVLLGSIMALWSMTRSRELIVARAAGVSVWQFLAPAIAIAFMIGAIGVTLFNPLAALAEAEYKRLENNLLKNQSDSFALTNSGLWLRQSDHEGTQAVIHAFTMTQPEMLLGQVSIFFTHGNDHLIRRLDAASARLEDDHWLLTDVSEWRPERDDSQHHDVLTIPTNLTMQKIEESFATPDTMSFWTLPGFIDLLEHSGFSAQKHKLYFDSLLARPFLLCAMVLIAAVFSLRMQRRGGTTGMLIGGVAAGFMLYFLSDIVFALGSSSTIPVALAAWTPAGISTLLGMTFLLHLEDG
jgi:lipopolysaccharide export system permease protein